jgi:hypothetical protein
MLPFDHNAHAFAVAVELGALFLLIGLGLAIDALWHRRPAPVAVRLNDVSFRREARPTFAGWRRVVQRRTVVAAV